MQQYFQRKVAPNIRELLSFWRKIPSKCKELLKVNKVSRIFKVTFFLSFYVPCDSELGAKWTVLNLLCEDNAHILN